MTRPSPLSRHLVSVLTGLSLAACGSSPPVQLYQLRVEPPAAASAMPPAADHATAAWALGPVTLPDYLDRDAIVQPAGQAGLATRQQQRWAEPLRDAVPRLLLNDLGQWRGLQGIWRSPAPAGVSIARLLRVEVQRFDARDDGGAVVLQARWALSDPSGRQAPQVGQVRLEAPAQPGDVDSLAAAHRLALWRLAQAIHTQATAP